MNGEYCGDFELDPSSYKEFRKKRDFTNVIKKWEPHTFFTLPFFKCNNLLPDGSNVKLPSCEPPK